MSKTQKNSDNQSPLRRLSEKDLGLSFDATSSHALSRGFATWIRALKQNWRQGTVACKARSDVAKTGKKPWKQKGTGRARAGAASSPLWRGGGVTFGPQPRVRSLSINREQKRLILRGLLQNFLEHKKIALLSWDQDAIQAPKTAYAVRALQESSLAGKRIALFVRHDDEVVFRSFRNISGISVITFDQPNAYHLADCESWAFLEHDLDMFKNMVAAWN